MIFFTGFVALEYSEADLEAVSLANHSFVSNRTAYNHPIVVW